MKIEVAQFREGEPIPKGICFGWKCDGPVNDSAHIHGCNSQRINVEFGDWIVSHPQGYHICVKRNVESVVMDLISKGVLVMSDTQVLEEIAKLGGDPQQVRKRAQEFRNMMNPPREVQCCWLGCSMYSGDSVYCYEHEIEYRKANGYKLTGMQRENDPQAERP